MRRKSESMSLHICTNVRPIAAIYYYQYIMRQISETAFHFSQMSVPCQHSFISHCNLRDIKLPELLIMAVLKWEQFCQAEPAFVGLEPSTSIFTIWTTERIVCILCMHLGSCRFFTHPTALMHLKSILSKCIQLHFIFLAHTRMGSHWELL